MKYPLLLLFLLQLSLNGFNQNYQEQFDSLKVQFNPLDRDNGPIILDSLMLIALEAKDPFLIGMSHYMRTDYLERSSNSMDTVIHHYEQAFASFKQVPDYAMMSFCKMGIAGRIDLKGSHNEARIQYKEGLGYAVKSGQKKNIVVLLTALGALEFKVGNEVKSLEYYQQALTVQESMTDSLMKVRVSPKGSMSMMYATKGDYEQAMYLLQAYLSELSILDNKWVLAQWTNNLATLCLDSGDTNLALVKSHEAMIFAEDVGFDYGIGSACLTLCDVHMNRFQFDSAKYYLDKIHRVLPVIEEVNFMALLSKIEGKYYQSTGQNHKAVRFFDTAYKIWETSEMDYQLAPLTLLMSENWATLGNYEEALNFSELHNIYKDSLFNREKIEEFKELEMTYTFDQQLLADSIENMKKLQVLELGYQEELNNEQRGKTFLVFSLILICLIVLFVFIAYRRNKKQAQLLNDKNEKIEAALAQNQLLLKEVHHRVKNNFQIVASLLELQSKDIEDEKALELAQEGQNRVKSMALIHQRLYQNDAFLIDFSEYLEKLVGDIASAYDHGESLKVEIDAGNTSFDVDTAIPLGLIINELVTNAFKYGFGKSERILRVFLSKGEEGQYELSVSDNGPGIPEGMDIQRSRSLGLRLVKRLSKQLHGNLEFSRIPQSTFTVRFKDTSARLQVD